MNFKMGKISVEKSMQVNFDAAAAAAVFVNPTDESGEVFFCCSVAAECCTLYILILIQNLP